jgi:hypothetical protein
MGVKWNRKTSDFSASVEQVKMSKQCYKTGAKNEYFVLVNKWVNTQMGIVVHLGYEAEFEALDFCQSHL